MIARATPEVCHSVNTTPTVSHQPWLLPSVRLATSSITANTSARPAP